MLTPRRRPEAINPRGVAPGATLRHGDLPAGERQLGEECQIGGRDSDGGVLAADVGFDHRGARQAGGEGAVAPVEERQLVRDGQEDQAVGAGVPRRHDVGMFDGELEGGVCGLGCLEARGEIGAAENVELAGRIKVALAVRCHGRGRYDGTTAAVKGGVFVVTPPAYGRGVGGM